MTIIATPSQIKEHFQKLRVQPGDLLVVKLTRESDVNQATVRRVIHALREIDVVQGARVVFLDPGFSLDHMTAAQLRDMGLVALTQTPCAFQVPATIQPMETSLGADQKPAV